MVDRLDKAGNQQNNNSRINQIIKVEEESKGYKPASVFTSAKKYGLLDSSDRDNDAKSNRTAKLAVDPEFEAMMAKFEQNIGKRVDS